MPKISDINLFELPEQRIVSIRTTVNSMEKLPMMIGEGYGKLAAYLEQKGVLIADVPFVCYHNMDMENLDVEFAFPVARPVPSEGEITCKTIPPQKAVACMYIGAYSDIGPVYNEMMAWIPENGHEIKGEFYEYYFNGPDRPESELLTKIVIPIK